MNISVRDLHNYMIKPSDNSDLDSIFDSVKNKVLISDKMSRLFIPPQVRKITLILRQIFVCEIFILSKDI